MSFGSKLRKLGRWIDPTYSKSGVRAGLRNLDPTIEGNWKNYMLGYFAPLGLLNNADKKLEQARAANAPISDIPLPPDPFDLQIREAAMNDLLLQRKGESRKSTFRTGPRGVEGPNKTVLG